MPLSGNEYFFNPARYLWQRYWFVQANRYTNTEMTLLSEASRMFVGFDGRFKIGSGYWSIRLDAELVVSDLT